MSAPAREHSKRGNWLASETHGAQRWTSGDRVRHSTKPEWGEGMITAVEPVLVEGKPSQRLTIRFERAGVKRLAAAVAALQPAVSKSKLDDAEELRAAQEALGRLDSSEIVAVLSSLPESARDPFQPLSERFRSTLELYRFSGEGGSLLDWAAMQTGLADPLSRFSRHELEQCFGRFRRALDAHARAVGLEIARNDPSAASKIVGAAPEAAKEAMRRVAAGR
ncbi:MAG: DUF3553 domain-containing protein [Planctomycetota bacterium]